MKTGTFLLLLAVFLLGLTGCTSQPSTPVTEVNTTDIVPTSTATPPPTQEAPTPTPTATATPEPLQSLQIPQFTVSDPQVIYTQPQRYTKGLRYWTDGNMGVMPSGDGNFIFFAANGANTARTTGPMDDPAQTVSYYNGVISGMDDKYPYSAGGPVYVDPESDMMLLFYHAEVHFADTATRFYSDIGMAVSYDQGETFQNLGIILSPNAEPSSDYTAEIKGGTYAIKDGWVYVYFGDVNAPQEYINLAVARAPLDEVVQAAKNGTVAEFKKYYQGDFTEPGINGRSSELEVGNPLNRWMSVTYNTFIDRFLMVIAETTNDQRTILYLTSSEDGITWTPRAPIQERSGELFYPSIIDPAGAANTTGQDFYVFYTAAAWNNRWATASLERIQISLSGDLVEGPSSWEFNTPDDVEGWVPLNQVDSMTVADGVWTIVPTGADPYLLSPYLGLSTEIYKHMEIRMKTDMAGVGEFFYTVQTPGQSSQTYSVRFDLTGDDQFHTYTIDLSEVPTWAGYLYQLRFDPTDQFATTAVDYIRLVP